MLKVRQNLQFYHILAHYKTESAPKHEKFDDFGAVTNHFTITKKGEQQTTTLPFIIKLIPFINNQDSAPNHSN